VKSRQSRGTFVLVAFLVAAALSAAVASASDTAMQGFLRYPAVHGNKVVFTSEGDLWITEIESDIVGGRLVKTSLPRRLTVHDGQERFAHFSPDGKWIAFTGQYDGNDDVFVIPAEGGEPRRLTYHPARDQVLGWLPDGSKIVFRSRRDSYNYTYKIFLVSPEGGYPEAMKLDMGSLITFEPGGARIAFNRFSREFRTWKGYRGGWQQDVWVGNLSTLEFHKITDFSGTDAFPMWYGDRIYFLSDREGRANLFSMAPDGSGVTQLTRHEEYDIRWPSLGGKRIVYQRAMDLWVYDIPTDTYAKLDIQLPSDRIRTRERFVNPERYVSSYDLSPDGKRLLLCSRGELFTFPTEKKGLIRRISHTPAFREKFASFSPDGKQVLAFSDATGEEQLFLYSAKGKGEPKQLTREGKAWRFPPRWSPDGKHIAFTDDKLTLNLVDAETGEITEIDKSEAWEIREYSWSPDSRFIVYSKPELNQLNSIYLYDLSKKKVHKVTGDLTNDTSPGFDPEGKYLYFLSDRYFNPYLDHTDLIFIFDKETLPYLVVLKAGEPSPFAPEEVGQEEEEGKKEDKDKKKDKDEEKKKEKEKVKVEIDFDGLAERVVKVPVEPGNYAGLRAVEGKIYYLSYENEGLLAGDRRGDEPRFSLHMYDLEKEKHHLVASGITGYDISDDGKKVVVRKKSEFTMMDAGATELPTDEDAKVDLSGWSLDIEPKDEWRQIFNEAWRLEREFFYDPNMHGVDWPAMKEKYGKLLPRVSTRDDLNDLIGEMIAELNTSHEYVWGGDIRRAKTVSVGLLGADVRPDPKSGYYRIEKVLVGDYGEEDLMSPLAQPRVHAKSGDYLLAIDGQPVKASENYLKLLAHKAGQEVVLTINDKPSMDGARDVIIKPMSSDRELRYAAWVRDRREFVEKATDGQVGYIHLPDMSGRSLGIFGKYYFPQHNKKGLIMDVRDNGGGFVAEMILAHLSRELWSMGKARHGAAYRTPTSAFKGPIAILCNQRTGSDGETFTEGAKLLKLGKVIGMRTWGGWVGIRMDKLLVDRGMVTQPEFSGWGVQTRDWLIEGVGSIPDQEVENDPASVIRGKDPQLEEAIKYVTNELKTNPPNIPPEPKFPVKKID